MKQSISSIRIKPHYTLIPHSSDQVELRTGIWNPTSFTLNDDAKKGKLYPILNDLNGKYSVNDISRKHNIPRAEVEGVLDQLQQLGVLEYSPSTLLDYYIEYACPSVMQRLYAADNLSSKKILIIGDNPISKALMHMLSAYFSPEKLHCLDTNSVQYKTLTASTDTWIYDALLLETVVQLFSDWKEYFIVFTQPVVNPILCSRLNMIAYELQIPWIHSAIDGPFLLIGPLFSVPSGPCYHCFESRVSMNLREHASYVKYKNAIVKNQINENMSLVLHSPLTYLLSSHLAMEILNYLATGTGFTRNKVLSIYLPTMEILYNEVLRVSTCPICGSMEHRDNGQLYFDYQSLFKGDSV